MAIFLFIFTLNAILMFIYCLVIAERKDILQDFIDMINKINVNNILTVTTVYILGPVAVMVVVSDWNTLKEAFLEKNKELFIYFSLIVPLIIAIFEYIFIKDINMNTGIFSIKIISIFMGVVKVISMVIVKNNENIKNKKQIIKLLNFIICGNILICCSTLINSNSVKLFIIIYINSFLFAIFFYKELFLFSFNNYEIKKINNEIERLKECVKDIKDIIKLYKLEEEFKELKVEFNKIEQVNKELELGLELREEFQKIKTEIIELKIKFKELKCKFNKIEKLNIKLEFKEYRIKK